MSVLLWGVSTLKGSSSPGSPVRISIGALEMDGSGAIHATEMNAQQKNRHKAPTRSTRWRSHSHIALVLSGKSDGKWWCAWAAEGKQRVPLEVGGSDRWTSIAEMTGDPGAWGLSLETQR